MTVTFAQVSVTTVATKIVENTASSGSADTSNLSFVIKNTTGTEAIFLGGSSAVTATNGFRWDVDDGPLAIDLEPSEQLWGVVATNTQINHVLGGGR